MADEPSITAVILESVRRLESSTAAGFASVTAKLDTKADKADIVALNGRLDKHEQRIEATETRQHEKDVEERTQQNDELFRKTKRQSRINLVLGLLGTLALVASVLVGILH